MNMSDDIAGAVINVSGRGVSEAARSARVMLEAILRLLRYLAKSRQMSKEKKQLDIQNKKILDIKGGKVSVKELLEHCTKNRDQLVSSEHGMTKEDAALLVAKAKKCGIPIALRKDGNAELTNIAPLTERITCFNAQKDEDVDAALRYVFMKSKLTALSEYRNVWLYIPSWEIAHYHASKLLSVMGRSRMAGVIMTASTEINDIIINDVVRHIVNNFDYLAFTDNIDK